MMGGAEAIAPLRVIYLPARVLRIIDYVRELSCKRRWIDIRLLHVLLDDQVDLFSVRKDARNIVSRLVHRLPQLHVARGGLY